MFRKLRRPFVSLICAALLISSISGCSSPKAATSSSPASGAASGAAADSGKITPEETDLTVVLNDNPNQPIEDYAPAQQEIFKETNIKLHFEVVSNSNYSDKKKVLLATNDLPDIIRVSTQDVNDYGNSGIFLQLDSYLNNDQLPNFKKLWESTPDYQKTLVDNKLSAFPFICRDEAKYGYGPVIRTDLLEKNKLAVPKTFDELLDVLTQLKKIYPDSDPWSVRSASKVNGTLYLLKTTAYMLGSGYGSNGLYYDRAQGKYIFGPATPEFKQVLSYLNKAYEAGVLDKNYATNTQQQWTEKLTSGKSFFFIDNSGFSLNYTTSLKATEPDGQFKLIPVPTNYTGKARAVYYATNFTGDFFAVSAKTKNPDATVKFMDWLYTATGSNITNFGVPGVSFDLDSKGQPQFKTDYVNKFKSGQPTPYYALYKDMGITKLNFSPWGANTLTQFQIMKDTGNWGKADDEFWSLAASDKAYEDLEMDPPLTKDEADRVKDINASLDTLLAQEYDKFIMGTEDISKYDDVIAKAKDTGSTELEKIYNDANQRAMAASTSTSTSAENSK